MGLDNRQPLGWEQPTTKHSTQTPSIKDVHWIAGFLEGEGTFRYPYVVSAGQVQKEPVERLLKFLGGSLRLVNREGENQQPHWVWAASGLRGRGILMTIYSIMSPKRKLQIRKALGHNVG